MVKWQAKYKFKKINNILDILTFIYIIVSIITIIFLWMNAPDRIPVHYGFDGKANAYGSKNAIFILLGLLVVAYMAIKLISNYPNKFNYLIPITDLNREKQYNIVATFMRILNLEVISLFFYLSMQSLMEKTNVSSLEILGFLAIIFATIAVQIFVSLRNR
ncbi:DUF1648 domain-containing protein [Helicobacter sp. 11S02596-1]|uniref:DUF1648 domain-containing protein n=1 Tax=Helicobacter sp. 11S02596-1 TaxID=1476194 RepID=UPI000BA7BB4F|nr:DUF1648 domain-containing protein [Helicobacter sp. 11S02596-1]PAF43171.1 hypothetical protein BJI48_05345 [Helicobacter sp. 11S02596-1]